MTLPAQDIVERLREAMDGVTPGKWERFPVDRIIEAHGGRYGVQSRKGPLIADCGEATNTYSRANATYIALCSPDNIGALLDTISRLTADNEALRKEVDEAIAAHHRTSHKAVKRLRALWREKQAAENRVTALEADVERLKAALEAARDQILDSYQTWIADDTGAFPRPGQIPRYDQVLAALGGSDHG